jgi:uncharacterized membrane protein
MSKFIRILGIALLAVSAVIGILYYAGPELSGPVDAHPVHTNTILIWGAILAGVAAVLALIFPLFQMVTHPRKAKGSLIGILVLVVFILIAYSFASSVPLDFTKPNENNVPMILKRVGTGLITMYILLGIGVLSIIFTEISKSFK